MARALGLRRGNEEGGLDYNCRETCLNEKFEHCSLSNGDSKTTVLSEIITLSYEQIKTNYNSQASKQAQGLSASRNLYNLAPLGLLS